MTAKSSSNSLQARAAEPGNPPAEVARRNLVTGLLALAGAGAATTLLSACAVEGAPSPAGEDEIGIAAQALVSGTNVLWVDTVFGSSYMSTLSFSRANGDLAMGTPATLAPGVTPSPKVAIASGAVYPNDGGGGIFFWDSTLTTAHDDGGTVIVPPGNSGGWRRVFSGELDVRWFGAIMSGADMAFPIQRAIDVAGGIYPPNFPVPSTRGGVHIPRGEWLIGSSLVVPRASLSGVSIRGDGQAQTFLRAMATLGPGSPILTFDNQYDVETYYFRLQDLTMFRSDGPGALFWYLWLSTGGDHIRSRLHESTFRNVTFLMNGSSGPSALDLTHCHDTLFENIVVQGGESALRLTDCSRLTFVKLSVNLFDNQSGNGIRLDRVGTTTFKQTRIEAVGGADHQGFGLYINALDNCGLLFDTLDFESKDFMSAGIVIAAGSGITFLNVNPAAMAPHMGLVIYPLVYNVRFIGGTLFAPIQIDPQAADIFFDNVKYGSDPKGSFVLAGERCRANLIWYGVDYGANTGSVPHAVTMTSKMIGPSPTLQLYEQATSSYAITSRGYDVWCLDYPDVQSGPNAFTTASPLVIRQILDGYDGQILTLILKVPTVLHGSTGTDCLHVAAAATMPILGTVQLVYNASRNGGIPMWHEISRSYNT